MCITIGLGLIRLYRLYLRIMIPCDFDFLTFDPQLELPSDKRAKVSDATLKPLIAAVHCFSSIGNEAQVQLCSKMTSFDVAAGED